MGFFDDALSAMGKSLAQSASGYVQGITGPVVGNMISTLFGGGQATGGTNLAELQKAILGSSLSASDVSLLNGQLAAQTSEIQNIGNQLTALSSAVAVIQSEVNKMVEVLNGIATRQLFQDWQAVDIQMTIAVNSIKSDYSELAGFIANYTNTEHARVASFMMNLQTNGPKDGMNLINAFILGSGGQSQGALQLWSAMVAPLVQKGLIDYREAVDQYTAYYQKLVAAQLLAANILVEVSNYFAINGDHTGAVSAWNAYKSCVLAQENEFIHWLVPLVYSGIIAYAGVPPVYPPVGYTPVGSGFTFYEGAMQLHPGLQALPGGMGYYAPSSIFEDAEAMLANLSVTDAVDRRIVVHMIFTDDTHGTFQSPIDANPLTLTHGKTSSILATTLSKFAYTDFPVNNYGYYVTPDSNFFNVNFHNGNIGIQPSVIVYLYRHVYSQDASNPTALPDGQYQLTNMNGKLPAMSTYVSEDRGLGKASFQEKKVLDYSLRVGPTSQFDFMNFGAYMISLIFPY
jgi:hypothetical protein